MTVDMSAPSRWRHVPNALSAYRILAVPFIVWAILVEWRMAFATLIFVNLLTDILDGLIARALHLETRLGAILDSTADIGTFVLAVTGMLVFEGDFVRAHLLEWGLIVGAYVIPQSISLIRHRRPLAMHLYSSKVTGYAQGIFFVLLFFFGYWPAAFYAMLTITLVNGVEETVVLVILRRRVVDGRGLYWLLKDGPRHE